MSNPRMTYGLTIVMGLLAFHPLSAQETDQSEREAMYRRYLDFFPVKGGTIEPHGMADGNSFWYVEGDPEEAVIWIVDPVADTKRPLFDVDRLRRALATTLGHEPPHRGMPFDRFTFTGGEKAVRFGIDGSEFVLDLDTYDIQRAAFPSEDELPSSETRGVPSPDGRWIATVRDYDLWLRSTEDGSEIQLTSDGARDHEWRLRTVAWSPNDFTRTGGDHEWRLRTAAWSPGGFTLAAEQIDSRHAPKIPLVDWLGPTEEVEWRSFPRRPGQPIARSELFLFDVRSGRRVRVDTGEEADRRIFVLGWLPDGSELLYIRMRAHGWAGDRGVALVAVDAITGATRVVLTEEEHPVYFITVGPGRGETPFTLLEDGRRFLWFSLRSGWRHLYLYDIAGNLIRPLTRGEFPVERVVSVDEASGWVYFTARGDTERHLYRVNLEGHGFTRLTEAPGQHEIRFAPSGQFFLDTHSSVDRPPAVELRRADGTLLQTLATADVTGLEELLWTPPEQFVVKAADGETDLYGVLYKPFDFDPGKKYPIILYAGSERSGHTFLQDPTNAMAQLGFIVFRVDLRSIDDPVTARRIGRYEVPDYVAALKGLAAERPYMDLSRVGVFGRSQWGYHAIRAMLQAPDVFHVGIAVNAVIDSYGHPNFYVLGSPESNKEAFEEASNLSLAGNLKGKLLLVHGTHDLSVPFSHAMKMVDALTRAGKPYDLIVLPGWGHWYPDTEQWERYRFEAYRRYFQEHLRP
ncbi:MAG: DPP IV N-terminal domain-containing protein [Gemmatimonadota bacterium]